MYNHLKWALLSIGLFCSNINSQLHVIMADVNETNYKERLNNLTNQGYERWHAQIVVPDEKKPFVGVLKKHLQSIGLNSRIKVLSYGTIQEPCCTNSIVFHDNDYFGQLVDKDKLKTWASNHGKNSNSLCTYGKYQGE